MNNRIFVVGDIHGCYRTLCKLLYENIKIEDGDLIYFLGDLVDRGPRVKEAVNEVIKLWRNGNAIALKGNHEEMLLRSITDPEYFSLWFFNGCESTLASFGVNHPKNIPTEYLDFFQQMPYFVLLDKFILVHGGLNFDLENPFEDTEYMLWGRYEIVEPEKIGCRRVVAGHTPTPLEKIIESLNEPKIFLDGGCVYKNSIRRRGLGYLVALELNSMQLYYEYNCDF